jgi:hypothetical protein
MPRWQAVGAETDPLRRARELQRSCERLLSGGIVGELPPEATAALRHVRELVTEQSALRQVATLVARESAPDELFAAVAAQVAGVFAVPNVRLVRYETEE